MCFRSRSKVAQLSLHFQPIMGQRQAIHKPNKLELKMQNKISYFLKCRESKKSAHWKAVAREVAEREKDLAVFGMQLARAERREEV